MNFEQFVRLVEQMRKAQRDYFRTRHPKFLEQSKQLEQQVDKAVRDISDNQLQLWAPDA